MATFTIHDEAGFPAEKLFLESWLYAVHEALLQNLGRVDVGKIHVVLSDAATHSLRFPPSLEEHSGLQGGELGEGDTPETPQVPTYEVYRRYAHGVTTLCKPSLRLPAAISTGMVVICLDVETIRSLALECDVSNEGMLGRVALHEMSHVWRGHPSPASGATHGFLREGDAQRDAWLVLADLMVGSGTATVARMGRAAQVRLARTQPRAYQAFGGSPSDSARWEEPTLPVPGAWVMRAARPLLPLIRQATIEVPVVTPIDNPRVGDEVFLLDHETLVGPWIVLGKTTTSMQGRSDQQRALEKRVYEDTRNYIAPTWLQLRRSSDLLAGRNLDNDLVLARGATALAMSIEGGQKSRLMASLVKPADVVLEEVAVELRTADADFRRDFPTALPPFDPFEDYDV